MTPDDDTPRDLPANGQSWAAASTVERHHTENKASLSRIEDRLGKLELRDAADQQRLVRIDELLTDIKIKVEGPRWWILVAIIAPIVLATAGAFVKLGSYPDADDVRATSMRIIQLEADLRLQRILVDTYRLQGGNP
jgi:hypothetical protein